MDHVGEAARGIGVEAETDRAVEGEGLRERQVEQAAGRIGQADAQGDVHIHLCRAPPVIPQADDRAIVHRVIYEELVLGYINPASRVEYQRIIETLIEAGAQGIILGCTEIGLLVKDENSRAPLFDTTRIHAVKAVEYALADR